MISSNDGAVDGFGVERVKSREVLLLIVLWTSSALAIMKANLNTEVLEKLKKL